jgi:hypothetical protein
MARPMKRLLQAPNLALATLWADLLQQGRHQRQRAARLHQRHRRRDPARPGLPEVWVLDDAEHARATELLHEMRHLPHRHWACTACGEIVDGPFEQCWNCGADRALSLRLQLNPRLALLMTVPPLMWAGNAIVGRLMVGEVPPLTLNFLRWLLTALILLPLGWRALRQPATPAQRWRYLLMVGLLGVGMYNALQYLAL